jgi:hypothetical protein
MAELEKNQPFEDGDDVEGHKAHGKAHGRLDDTDPDEAKLKLANDEDEGDDVEAHKAHGKQQAG